MVNNTFNREHVVKVWGSEEIIVNNERYCGKLLRLLQGYQCSLHMHRRKAETFLVLEGSVMLEVHVNDRVEFHTLTGLSRDSFDIEPGTYHRFAALAPNSLIVEFSTPHSDADVSRKEESRKRD